ncbi:kinase-like domain-containing protein [Rhizophagus irregularis DAOM 181602=DAOM 197198]|nr:kinase-like domain-containing protein [Rhizophagus irregularis DAOM 181602=DAOM 197198]
MVSLIINWVKGFIKLLSPYSPSQMQLLKLHNWIYHIIAAIKEHDAINGFMTISYKLFI